MKQISHIGLRVIEVIRFGVMLITLGIWSVIGFIVWIPLLVRITGMFSFSILHATITGTSTHYYSSLLDKAIVFYIEGFRKIIETINYNPDTKDSNVIPPIFDWIQFSKEIFYSLIFWFSLLIIISNFQQITSLFQ